MHSRIFELSERPVPTDERLCLESVPDWFFSSISDFAEDISDEDREDEIKWLAEYFHNLCTAEGDKLTFDPATPEKRFKRNYSKFLEKAAALTAMSYEAFCGRMGGRVLEYTLFELNDAYEDKYGFYVYEPESLNLRPINAWLREADLTKPFYVGGIVNYHW